MLRFGAYDPEVLERLRWMAEVLGPALDAALRASEPIDLKTMIGQALGMGDEGHNRYVAASALLARRLAPAIAPLDGGVEVLTFLAGNDHFALNLSMAAGKLCMDAAAHVPDSSLVTAMSRNGVEFGIRVAGTGDRWFTAPVGPADGLFFPGYGPDDANPDMGDWAITETLGHRRFRHGGRAVDHDLRRRHAGRRAGREPRDARGSRSRRTPPSRCRRSTSSAARRASTCSRCSTPASCR